MDNSKDELANCLRVSTHHSAACAIRSPTGGGDEQTKTQRNEATPSTSDPIRSDVGVPSVVVQLDHCLLRSLLATGLDLFRLYILSIQRLLISILLSIYLPTLQSLSLAFERARVAVVVCFRSCSCSCFSVRASGLEVKN